MSHSSGQPATWSSRREAVSVIANPQHLRRTVTITLTVGTVFFAMNQLPILLSGHLTALLCVKAALTYLTPLCVSNIGILTATHRTRDTPGLADGLDGG